jgi:hypothetical protein
MTHKRKWGFRRIANFEVELIASDQGTGKWTETRRQLKENTAHTERIFLFLPITMTTVLIALEISLTGAVTG